MINSITTYAGGYPAITKQTYIDKYDKSLKLPFLSALNSNLPNGNTGHANEAKTENNVNTGGVDVALNYAVTGSSEASSSGNATYA